MARHNFNIVANESIKYKVVRLVNEDGSNRICETRNARLKAQQEGKDLILINEKSEPPIVKIIKLEKYRYELEKKRKNEEKKIRMNRIEVKEAIIRPNTDKHDLNRIKNRVNRWLENGYNVKLNMLIKGREINHKDKILELFNNFLSEIKNYKLEGDKIYTTDSLLSAKLISNKRKH